MNFECILGHRWTGDEDDEWTDGEQTLPVCPTCSSDGFRATPPRVRFAVGDRVVYVDHCGGELTASVLNDYDGGPMVRILFDDGRPVTAGTVEMPRSFLRPASVAVA